MHLHYLDPQHLEELVKSSGIDLHLVQLNFQSLQGVAAYEYLLISELLPRTNTGMVKSSWLQGYAHVTEGGWWCSGLDPLKNWQIMEWGCFKPNQPRQNHKGKSIKYEHPPSTPTRVFCLRVTLQIWQQVAQRYNLAMPDDITINPDGEAKGFWQWVMEKNISVIICEGVKKAATLLTQGYVAIGVPGITSGYRVVKDEFGKVTRRQLIPDLALFTATKRRFYICFDFETQPQKIAAINNAISQLGCLFQKKNCSVKVIELPGKEKGVDDFIVAKGATNFEKLYRQSLDLEIYLAQTKPHSELNIPAALTFNRPYIGEIPFPTSGLVGVKSAKGTGKTTALESIVQKAKKTNQPVLLITHRILLGRFLCEKIGIQWGAGNRGDKEVWGVWGERGERFLPHPPTPPTPPTPASSHAPSPMPKSFGLCIDSIWKLNTEDWHGAIVILDEVEQSLWHLLNSNTCKHKRVKILKVFQELIATVLTTGGLVIAQDADLSNVSLEYLQGLSGIKLTPWVVINEWKPQQGWDVTFYDSPNPTPLIHQLELDLLAGRKCYVTTDSRAGRYSCETIESYLKERLQKLRREFPQTLVVSSHTTNTPGHAAVDFIAAINQKISEYDGVFVTPSLGTGISIDVRHFDRVYGIFQGVIPDSEARQALARVRDDVPRVVWCAKRGIGLIGSGSTNYRLLSDWYQENQKENLALLSPLHKIDVDLPLVHDPIHLRTWAKLSARVNASIRLYRQSMQDGLIADGHVIQVRSNAVHNNIIRDLRLAFLASDRNDLETRKRLILEIVKVQKDWAQSRQKAKDIKRKIKEIKQQNQLATATAVANANNIDYVEYEQLLLKQSLTDEERNQLHKYVLRQKYGIAVTPSLKLQDDRGYYSQLLIHYYLTHESEYFHIKDQQEWHQQLSWGEGKVFLPDLKTYTLKVEAMRALGILQFLEDGREFTQTDSDLMLLKNIAFQHSKHIKRVLGINFVTDKEQLCGIKILSKLLNLLGLKLKRENEVYKIDSATLNDGRQKIFVIWQQRDELMLAHIKSGGYRVPDYSSEWNIKIIDSKLENLTSKAK
ncbi:DNA primase [Nostoc linckia z18]|uniref:DNA primase n=2 Tax=Nostoc linckia TaxID=92942 RepID=A0A9Q6EHX4_NOSLI|nr:plasmid replication protein, CyRepA1 family [Nostoc linckia]PHK41253.1 DNA primase [Nostoc linckia z15]PHK45216.1 DNA primase [Nostoc linckia z16]PHJ62457.1 DNA primase [Nostoc linckia z1]PHJ62530.1 DNA primase [Nostoc linckia z3]PHJ71289.1 DNA primase [Nostoc linckia z2]